MGKIRRILIENERLAALRLDARIGLPTSIPIVFGSIKRDALALLADCSITAVASVILIVVVDFEIDIVKSIKLENLIITLRSISEYLQGV